MIEFPFEKRYSDNLGKILKPYIPVNIIGPKKSVNIFMLLDSGADISMIPYSVGEIIGLDLDMEKHSEVQGIGESSVPYILSNIKLNIREFKLSIRVGWALIEEVPFILGRLDFFQAFSVEFRSFENKILLDRQK